MQIQQEYNNLLKRCNNGMKYLDDNNIPIQERESKVSDFRMIVGRLNNILWELKQQGINATNKEILEGFEVV